MSKKLLTLAILLVIAIAATLIVLARRGQIVARGCFHQVAHRGRGCAMLIRESDGKTVLQLSDFATTENPDLRVLLISEPDALENTAVMNSRQLDLGPLQASEGQQRYVVPKIFDLDGYHAVTVWNSRYQVNFTTAPLERQ